LVSPLFTRTTNVGTIPTASQYTHNSHQQAYTRLPYVSPSVHVLSVPCTSKSHDFQFMDTIGIS